MSLGLTSFIPTSTTSASPATSVSTSTLLTTTHYGVAQSFPPMTTPWSTPQSCTWTYDVDGVSGPVAWLDLEPISDATTLSCYPDGMFFNDRTGVFSPGTCPSGWTTVSTHQNTNEKNHEVTTTAVCCSSEYTLDGDRCFREVPTILAVPISYNKSATTYDIMPDSTSTLTSATLAVHTIRALFQKQDKEVLGLLYQDMRTSKNEGLSLNGRIGLGIGMAILGLIIISIGTWLVFRRPSCRKPRGGSSHELGNVSRGSTPSGDGLSGIPRPAYEVATARNSSVNDGSRASTDRGEEIEVLKAQKEAIQRRIEELERVDTDDDTQQR